MIRPAVTVCIALLVASNGLGAQEPQASTPSLGANRPTPRDSVLGAAPAGGWLRAERGFSIATLDAERDAIDEAPSLPAALQARIPGASVRQGEGFVGSSSRVWLRGPSGLFVNEPLLIIDGVRSHAAAARRPFDLGPLPSRLEDIDPQIVERVEILRGAAASAIYGPGASKGVVLVTTKRGERGPARWGAFAETGPLSETTDFPANFGTLGQSTATGEPVANCTLAAQGAGSCTPTTRRSWNPLENASPFRTGWTSAAGLNVSGGTERTTYRASVLHDRATGVYRRDAGNATGASLNVSALATPAWEVRLSGVYRVEELRHPTVDYLSLGLRGQAVDDPERRGYGSPFSGSPEERGRVDESGRRVTAALSSTWTPRSWLRGSVLLGYDRLRVAHGFSLREAIPTIPGLRDLTSADSATFVTRTKDAPESRTGTAELEASYRGLGGAARTAVGFQYLRDDDRGDAIEGSIPDAPGGPMFLAETHIGVRRITKGFYARQHVGWNDVFLTGTLRIDRPERELFGTLVSPSIDVAWHPIRASSNGSRVGSDLRLRAAYGRGGGVLIPTPEVSQSGTGFRPSRESAERMEEIELGADVSLLGERILAQITAYRATNDQALIERTTPVTTGPLPTYLSNDSEYRTFGVEGALDARVVDRDGFTWDLGFGVAAHDVTAEQPGEPPLIFASGGQRIQHGKSIGEYHPGSYGYTDENGDRLIAPSEVVISREEATSVGSPLPSYEASVRTDLALGRRIRLSALLDRRAGQVLYNLTARARCTFAPNCQEQHDPDTPLHVQAAAVAAQRGTVTGYIEDASYTRLRELRLTITLPRSWAGSVSSARITLTGRNLYLWTGYSGLDPEIVSRDLNSIIAADSFYQPPLRTFAARLDVSW